MMSSKTFRNQIYTHLVFSYFDGNDDADDTTLMAESEEELKSLLMKFKEESEKVSLKLNIQKMKMASCPIILQQIDGETNGNRGRLYCLGLQNHCRW